MLEITFGFTFCIKHYITKVYETTEKDGGEGQGGGWREGRGEGWSREAPGTGGGREGGGGARGEGGADDQPGFPQTTNFTQWMPPPARNPNRYPALPTSSVH